MAVRKLRALEVSSRLLAGPPIPGKARHESRLPNAPFVDCYSSSEDKGRLGGCLPFLSWYTRFALTWHRSDMVRELSKYSKNLLLDFGEFVLGPFDFSDFLFEAL